MQPEYIRPDDVPKKVKDKEMEIYKEQLKAEGKPANVQNKILEGRMTKFYEQVCLLNQPYIKDDKQTIGDLVNAATAKLGEKIEVKQITVFSLA